MDVGAHKMNVPEELRDFKFERAELMIALSPAWNMDIEFIKDERLYWPVGLLKKLARLPIITNSWLCYGHTIDNQESFARDTKLSASFIIGAPSAADDIDIFTPPNGDEINFYHVIPIYKDEMEYRRAHGARAFHDFLDEVGYVVDPKRPSCIASNENEGHI